MTLQEILNKVMQKYPHSYSDGDIIGMVNQVQEELFRTIYKPHTATQYDLIADNPFYVLDYSPKRIIELLVNGREYKLVNIRNDNTPCEFYYEDENNAIGIYPTPIQSVSSGLVIFHYMEPKTLTVSDLNVEPDFESAWHMLLVYRVCKELAEEARDSDMANGFTTQINGYESEYFRDVTYEPTEIDERW